MRPSFVSEEMLQIMQERVRSGVAGTRMAASIQGTVTRTSQTKKISCAGSTPASSPPFAPYRNKLETAYANYLEGQKLHKLIRDYAYENLTFKLAKGQYHRNDFLIWHLDGTIEICQVKGWHKNIRAGIKGMKWAAQLNPWFSWKLVRRNNHGGWDEESL